MRREIFETHYQRYQKAEKKDKGKILKEITGTTGLNRDHLAHVLANYWKKRAVEIDGKTVILEARHPRQKRERGKRGGRPAKKALEIRGISTTRAAGAALPAERRKQVGEGGH
jgi:hypothetical protein